MIGRGVKIPYCQNDLLSNTMRMVGDGVMAGDLRAFQKYFDITKLDAPWFILVRWMSFWITITRIWKSSWWDSLGALCLVSKVMRLDSMGSSPLMTDNNAFCCTGHVCKTYKVDISHGDWARSSTME